MFKTVTKVSIALNFVMAVALALCGLYIWMFLSADTPVQGPPPAESTSGGLVENYPIGSSEHEPEVETNPELDSWIDNLKFLAEKHLVDPHFLQELFPGKIVYRYRGQTIYADISEERLKHSYDFKNLTEDENKVRNYVEEGGLTGLVGIDVSEFQGTINWTKVKDAGVSFAIIRMGYRGYGTGKLVEDKNFKTNIKNATAAGVSAGVYFFSQAITVEEAEEEADMVLKAIKDHAITYPIVFDMEDIGTEPRIEDLTPEEITDITIAFCNRIEENGYKAMVYGNVSWFLARVELERLEPRDIWFAQYRPMPYYPYDFKMWQYTSSGSVDGIDGNVDFNISFVDYSEAAELQ